MQAVELRFNVIFAKNIHLINSPNRYVNNPLNRKYSHKPFNKQSLYMLNITDY